MKKICLAVISTALMFSTVSAVATAAAKPAAAAPAAGEPGKREVRTVGPTFLPAR